MAKREPLNIDEYAKRDTVSPVAETAGEEPQATLYCRCPLSLAVTIAYTGLRAVKGEKKARHPE